MAALNIESPRTPSRGLWRVSRAGRVVFLCIFSLLAGLSACKSSAPKRGEDIETKAPIQAENVEAQRRFDAAMELLKAGEYLQAREAFRMVQAEFSGDPIATLAEVYVARASMGAVDPMGSFTPEATAKYDGSPEAAQILAALGESDTVDERIRYGAAAYYALELALRGQTDEALAALGDYPSASLSNVVLDQDRLAVRTLLLESFWRAGRDIDTVEAAAKLYQGAADALAELGHGPGLTPEETSSTLTAETAPGEADAQAETPESRFLQGLQALSRERAFSVAEKSSDDLMLQDYLTGEVPFLRAIAGWRVLERSLSGDLSEEARAGLEDLFNEIAPDLVAIGATSRAAELSQRLASVGGPKRLAIGFLLPLSGSYQAIGQRAMAGALVAMQAFHHSAQPEVTLIFEDSQADPAAVFERLKQNKVLAVVGPLDTRRARAFAPLARENKIPLITLTTESVRQTTGEDESEDMEAEGLFVFRNFIDAAAEARAAARIAFEQIGDRRAAVVFPQIGYGQVTSAAFADEFRSLGGQIVAEIPYDRTQSDFAKVAQRLAKSGAQAVFVPDSAEKVAELSAFFANENIWGIAPDKTAAKKSRRTQVHYLGTSLWENPILVRQAASYVEGATIPVWFSATLTQPEVKNFAHRFEAIYGRAPDEFEAFSYDTVAWLRDLLLKRGMRRPVAIRDALLAGGVYHGVTGEVSMNSGGEAQRVIRFVTPTAEGFVALPFSAQTAVREQPGLNAPQEE